MPKLRSVCLPLLCLLFLPTSLLAEDQRPQKQDLPAKSPPAKTQPAEPNTAELDTAEAATPGDAKSEDDNAAAAGNASGAHPAPEPDTAMLLGTGAVVLLLLYARRRVRVGTPRTAQVAASESVGAAR